MPILPIIDTLILLSWTTLTVGGGLKVCNLIFGRNWLIIGMAPTDLLLVAMVLLVFAIALIGRAWVKLNDPTVIAKKRVSSTLEAYAITRSKADGENGGESTGAVESSARG